MTTWSCICRLFRQFIIIYWNFRDPTIQFWSREVVFCLTFCEYWYLIVKIGFVIVVDWILDHIYAMKVISLFGKYPTILIHFLKTGFWLIYPGWPRSYSALQMGLKFPLAPVYQVLGILWTCFTMYLFQNVPNNFIFKVQKDEISDVFHTFICSLFWFGFWKQDLIM